MPDFSGQLSKLGDKHKQLDLAQAHGIDRTWPHNASTLSDLFTILSVGERGGRDGETETEREREASRIGLARSLGRR